MSTLGGVSDGGYEAVRIQPLEFPQGLSFGRLLLRVFARHMRIGELPADLGMNHQVWRLTASVDERDSLGHVDPVRQMGNLLVISSVEGVRRASDEWVSGLTAPTGLASGVVAECSILDITEEHPVEGRPYADFIRSYELERSGFYEQR